MHRDTVRRRQLRLSLETLCPANGESIIISPPALFPCLTGVPRASISGFRMIGKITESDRIDSQAPSGGRNGGWSGQFCRIRLLGGLGGGVSGIDPQDGRGGLKNGCRDLHQAVELVIRHLAGDLGTGGSQGDREGGPAGGLAGRKHGEKGKGRKREEPAPPDRGWWS